jgi:hypothetical protein
MSRTHISKDYDSTTTRMRVTRFIEDNSELYIDPPTN